MINGWSVLQLLICSMFCSSLLIYGTPFAQNKLEFSAHSKNNGVSWGVQIWSECSWGHRVTLSQFCYRNYHYPISSSSLWGNGSYSPSLSSGAINWLQIKDLCFQILWLPYISLTLPNANSHQFSLHFVTVSLIINMFSMLTVSPSLNHHLTAIKLS